jgi:uncharacterized protein (DUF927 family)
MSAGRGGDMSARVQSRREAAAKADAYVAAQEQRLGEGKGKARAKKAKAKKPDGAQAKPDGAQAPSEAERDAAIIDKLISGDADPYIARAEKDPGFPFEPAARAAYILLAENEEKQAYFLRLRARLKTETEVSVKTLDDVVRKARRGGGAAAPDGEFSMTHTGLYRVKGAAFEWISQPFEVLARARAGEDDWGKVISFSSQGIRTRQALLDSAMLHGEPIEIIKALARQGMDIKGTKAARDGLVEYLLAARPEELATIASCTGWIEVDGKRAFVLPDEIVGGGGERVILARGVAGPYERRGTLEDWQAGVGKLVAEHCLPRFAVAVGFAGALLYLGGFESGAFHFYGQSSEGKTTCVRCAASVWGSGADGGYMRTWRATSNGLESNLAAACDTLLPIDEIGQTEGKEAGLALYMATSGVGKQRMRRDATLKASYKWRVLMLSSGEMPIEAKLSEDLRRARAHAGHLVRAIDVSARRECGAFDRAYVDFDPLAFADKLKRATLTHYGTAGPEFVRRLIEKGIDGDQVRTRVAAFVEDTLKESGVYHGQVARVAERFGLVAVAGELAIELGVAPWEKGQPTTDATELFAAWLKERGGSVAYEAGQIVARVRHFIAAHGDSRFDDLDPPPTSFTGQPMERRPVNDRAGWREGEGDDRRWYVTPEMFRRDICAGFNFADAVRVLAQIGALEKGADGKSSQVKRLGGMKPQRVYVLTPAVFEGAKED